MASLIEPYLTYQTATWTLLALPLLATVKVLVHYFIASRLSTSALRRMVSGKNIVVTGGSKGLGKGIAKVLVENGANVTIVARGLESLKEAQKELRAIAGDRQVFVQAIDLSKAEKVVAGVKEIRKVMGRVDWVIHNAGSAVPGFLADQLNQEVESMTSQNLLATGNVVKAFLSVAKEIAEDKKVVPGSRTWPISGLSAAAQEELPAKFIFVGSLCSAMSFIGFSAYSASKYGQRGFADALRSEFAPLGVDVHLYLPANMDTPGFQIEGSTKPEITAQIEGTTSTATPEEAAKALLAGVLNNRYQISNDILGELIRIGAQGGVPRPNPITEALAAPVVSLAFTIWVMITEYEVKSFFKAARPATQAKKSN
ncbi:hypothetical protein BDR26DRAFT_841772 [Obelidium mucronatum]|nr:hypothetical protein BDR26DRAFT_841772 [Obelidium mucronatum]